jgi:hypothetical protein
MLMRLRPEIVFISVTRPYRFVIARLDPKSGLPDFGIKIVEIGNIRFRCNPVSIGRWLLDRPVKPGDDSAEWGGST